MRTVRTQRVISLILHLKAQVTEEMTNLLKQLKFLEHLKAAHNCLLSEAHRKIDHQNFPDADEQDRVHTDGEIFLLVSPQDEPEDSNPSHCHAHSSYPTGGKTWC
jgi:hypothetical protein